MSRATPLTLRGVVEDEAGPVAGAIVRVRGTNILTTSDEQGRFELVVEAGDEGIHLAAWRPGYYIAGNEEAIQDDTDDIILSLRPHFTTDQPDYQFISPLADMSNPSACGHCHLAREGEMTMPVEEWLADAHFGAATNPRFLSLYNGTTLTGERGSPTAYEFDAGMGIDLPVAPSLGQGEAGPGFRLDFPDQGGTCAACHVPIAALDAPYDTNANHATGVAIEGVTCDFCHKIQNVRLQTNGLPNPALPGVLSLEMLRPGDGEQIFLGPYDDTPGDDVFSPLQNQSEFCAACHFGAFWGVTIYNSFGEWLDSPYSDPATGQTCQDCHMPHSGATSFVQLPPERAHYVPERDPQTIFSHRMPGAMDEELLQATAILQIDGAQVDGQLLVTVSVTNSGAGHHIPTDNPLRNMILLVSATAATSETLALIDGPTIPAWGGVGNPADGYYAGLPGVLYAKILADFYTGEMPTPAYWRQTRLVSDNRIPALVTDTTVYNFALPASNAAVTVEARLYLRRAFIDLMALKGWNTPDILMASETMPVGD